MTHRFAFSIMMIMGVGALVSCETLPPQEKMVPTPYRMGSIWVDPAKHEISMSGYVNQVVGQIELLACGTAGKTHESAFVVYAKAVDIHAGLLLLGLKHGDPMPGLGEGPPAGDPVLLEIEWMDGETRKREPAGKFIHDLETKKEIKRPGWIFNGSTMIDGQYMAKMEDSFVASYWDPWSIINLESELGQDDERLVINRKAIPPLHTPIRFIIKPAKKSR